MEREVSERKNETTTKRNEIPKTEISTEREPNVRMRKSNERDHRPDRPTNHTTKPPPRRI
jgi:hypothetical protein